MTKQNAAWNRDGLPSGLTVIIKQTLMVRINRAMRTRRCIECSQPIPARWPGVTCGSKKCMAKWLPGKKEAEIEPVVVEQVEE